MLLRFGWKVMLHPPYSLDLAPSDNYLFRSLQNSWNGKILNDDEAVKSHLVQFFADKDYIEKKMLLNQKHVFPKACISWIQINML